jgi:hypothetical protein
MYTQDAINFACSSSNRPQVLLTALGRKILNTEVGQLEFLDDQVSGQHQA